MAMSGEQRDEQTKAYGRVVAKAWSDEAFKQRLLADPGAVLKAEGVALPEDAELRLVENTDNLVYLTLPAKPSALSDEQLGQVAGGVVTCFLFANANCDAARGDSGCWFCYL